SVPQPTRTSLAYDSQGDLAAVPSARHDDDAIDEAHAEIHVHRPGRLEKALHIRIVNRLDTQDVRPGRQAAGREIALRVQRERPDHRAARHVEGHDVRAED